MPIIASEEEFWQDSFTPQDCKEYVGDVPEGFKSWIAENAERIEDASRRGTLPYFMWDNVKYTNEVSYFASNRHLGEGGHHEHKPTKHGEQFESIPLKPLSPSAEVLAYTENQAKGIGAKMQAPMTFEEADRNKANMTKDDENCQSAVVAFYARLLGMDVTAKPYIDGGEFVKLLANDQTLAYYTNTKDKIHPAKPKKLMSIADVNDFIENQTAKNGVYNFAVNKYIDDIDGHIMCLIKNEGKPYLCNIQTGKMSKIEDILSLAEFKIVDNKKIGVEILRVDKLVLSEDALNILSPL